MKLIVLWMWVFGTGRGRGQEVRIMITDLPEVAITMVMVNPCVIPV